MDWNSILMTLVSVLFGGGIVGIFTIREQKKSLKLENKAKEIDNAIKDTDRLVTLVNELQDQNEVLNERLDKKDALIQEKDDIISDLRTKLDNVRTQCSVATLLRCRKISCQDRVPPISEAFTGNIDEQLTKYVENL